MAKPRVVVADDHELLIDGLRKLLDPDFEVVGTATDGRAAIDLVDSVQPDLLMLDIGLPLLNGIEVARQIKRSAHNVRVLFVTMQTGRVYVEEAFRAGASGYMIKQSAAGELSTAIRTILHGGVYISPLLESRLGASAEDFAKEPPSSRSGKGLTPRQREVLQLIAEGESMKEIASILEISVRTVEFHKNALMEQLGRRSVAELTRYAIEEGIALV